VERVGRLPAPGDRVAVSAGAVTNSQPPQSWPATQRFEARTEFTHPTGLRSGFRSRRAAAAFRDPPASARRSKALETASFVEKEQSRPALLLVVLSEREPAVLRDARSTRGPVVPLMTRGVHKHDLAANPRVRERSPPGRHTRPERERDRKGRAIRRSTSQFFGVIHVGRQCSVPPANQDDPAV
jgi:hypothetical protein